MPLQNQGRWPHLTRLLAVWMACVFLGSAAFAQNSQTVTGIAVQGNQRIEGATIRSYLTVTEGDAFDPARIDRSIKNLFSTGLFADVSIGRQGDLLLVRVVENPIINRISIEGNKRIEDD